MTKWCNPQIAISNKVKQSTNHDLKQIKKSPRADKKYGKLRRYACMTYVNMSQTSWKGINEARN